MDPSGVGPSARQRPAEDVSRGPLRFTVVNSGRPSDAWPWLFAPLWVGLPLVLGSVRAGVLGSGRWVMAAQVALWLPTCLLIALVLGRSLDSPLRGSGPGDRRVPFVVYGRTRPIAVILGPISGGAILYFQPELLTDPAADRFESWLIGGAGVWLIGWACMIIWRQRIEVRPDALVIVQRLSTITIPWYRITDIQWDTLNPDTMDFHYRLLIQTDRGRVISRVPTTRNQDGGPVARLRLRLLALAAEAAPTDDPIVVSGVGRWTAGMK